MVKGRKKWGAGKGTTVSVGREFADRIKEIAHYHRLTIPEALDKFAGPAVLRECRRILDAKQRSLAESDPKFSNSLPDEG